MKNIASPGDDLASIPPADLPIILPILPLDQFILFPGMIAPILVGDEKSRRLIDEALSGPRVVGILTKRADGENLSAFRHLFRIGTTANILKMLKMPDGSARVLVHGMDRFRVAGEDTSEPFLKASVEYLPDAAVAGAEIDALTKNIHQQLGKAIDLSNLPDDLRVAAGNLVEPGRLADLVAANLPLKMAEQQEVLETLDVRERLQRVLYILNREIEVMELGNRIQTQVKTELDRNQREYLLREQLKAIRRELGDEEGHGRDVEELRGRVAAKALPHHAREAADRELGRLRMMQPSSAEYTVSRSYLETLLELPWLDLTKDTIDLRKARRVLDRDHFGLERAKERILEHLAVRKLKKDNKGPIICLVGPPGVGKTSLGRSIAEAMGRKFLRISLGGMRDEAEIRGHRRTYIGAMPGRLLKGLRTAGSANPVMMLDEIDKLGSDYRGDPASALLEVLDPEQNHTFQDHYLDLPFDLSNVLFITTANQLDAIPGPLRDRMEIIEVTGYATREKLAIAQRYLVPKQLVEHGLARKNIEFPEPALRRIVEDHTREAGLRSLERMIGAVCRKVARVVAEGRGKPVRMTAALVTAHLGPPKFFNESAQRMAHAGVAIGLGWTPTGGEILFIETAATDGSGKLELTGQLGDVMKESARAALTYLRSNAVALGLPLEALDKHDLHVHVPAGATPKDGPSAGTAIAAALASLATGRRVKDFLAMTGEVTLQGHVLPVGGVKEKVLAAARAGIREILLPARNLADLSALPADVRKRLKIHPVETLDQVLALALAPAKIRRAVGVVRPKAAPRRVVETSRKPRTLAKPKR